MILNKRFKITVLAVVAITGLSLTPMFLQLEMPVTAITSIATVSGAFIAGDSYRESIK